MEPGKVYGYFDFEYVIFKYFYLRLFNFVKFSKCAKNIMKSANYEEKKFIMYKEKMLTDKATIKSCKRRWARSVQRPSIYIYMSKELY